MKELVAIVSTVCREALAAASAAEGVQREIAALGANIPRLTKEQERDVRAVMKYYEVKMRGLARYGEEWMQLSGQRVEDVLQIVKGKPATSLKHSLAESPRGGGLDTQNP